VDLLRNSGCFTREEAQEYIDIGVLNGLFVLGRTIGFIGKNSLKKKKILSTFI
jgi:ATP citrate (pro-S)-lyase